MSINGRITELSFIDHPLIADHTVEINGNVIVVCGSNGSGKSRFFSALNKELSEVINSDLKNLQGIFRQTRKIDIEVCFSRTKYLEALANSFNVDVTEVTRSLDKYFPSETTASSEQQLNVRMKLSEALLRFEEIEQGLKDSGELERFDKAMFKPVPQDSVALRMLRAFSEFVAEFIHPRFVDDGLNPQGKTGAAHDLSAYGTTNTWMPSTLFCYKQAPPKDSHLNQIYEAVQAAFRAVTNCGFDVTSSQTGANTSSIFVSDTGTNKPYPIMESGRGLRNALFILLVAHLEDLSPIIVDEPEGHLHPAVVRKLIDYLATKTSKQFILATHSAAIIRHSRVASVLVSRMTPEGKIYLESVTDKVSVLREIGHDIQDLLTADFYFLTEGQNDAKVFRRLMNLLLGDELTEKISISYVPMGGSNMKNLCDFLAEFESSEKVQIILDKEPNEEFARAEFKTTASNLKIPLHTLERYAIENYLPPRLYERLGCLPLNEGGKFVESEPVNLQLKRTNEMLSEKDVKIDEATGIKLRVNSLDLKGRKGGKGKEGKKVFEELEHLSLEDDSIKASDLLKVLNDVADKLRNTHS